MFPIGLNSADNSAFVLVVGGVVHPISRHYTRSDRVQCSLTGAVLLNGCNAPDWVESGRGASRAAELPLLCVAMGAVSQ